MYGVVSGIWLSNDSRICCSLCPVLFCEEKFGQLWSSKTRASKKSSSVVFRSQNRSGACRVRKIPFSFAESPAAHHCGLLRCAATRILTFNVNPFEKWSAHPRQPGVSSKQQQREQHSRKSRVIVRPNALAARLITDLNCSESWPSRPNLAALRGQRASVLGPLNVVKEGQLVTVAEAGPPASAGSQFQSPAQSGPSTSTWLAFEPFARVRP